MVGTLAERGLYALPWGLETGASRQAEVRQACSTWNIPAGNPVAMFHVERLQNLFERYRQLVH
jgi:hypothetical protein